MKPFAVFDVDGTLFRFALYHSIVKYLFEIGRFDEAQGGVIRDSFASWDNREHSEAFWDYVRANIGAYNKYLPKMSIKEYKDVVDAVFEKEKMRVYTYPRDLLKDLKSRGYTLFAISGSQTEIVEPFARYYGFDAWVGSTQHRAGKGFSGEITPTNKDKHRLIKKLAKKYNVAMKGSIAIGDTDSDISLLELVDHPIAFNPNAQLLKYAASKNWKIVIERKNAVYELEKKGNEYVLVNIEALTK